MGLCGGWAGFAPPTCEAVKPGGEGISSEAGRSEFNSCLASYYEMCDSRQVPGPLCAPGLSVKGDTIIAQSLSPFSDFPKSREQLKNNLFLVSLVPKLTWQQTHI